MAYKILIVEDDKNAGFLLEKSLEDAGYGTILAQDGIQGLSLFDKHNPDLCILDIMLPLLDGLNLSKAIRKKNNNIPIVFLTARTMQNDIIEGFKYGADDYITKPYEMEELLLRVKAILRRNPSNIATIDNDKIFKVDNFIFSSTEKYLIIEGQKIEISTKECDIIICLTNNYTNIISREHIMNKVWGKDDVFASRSLDVYLTRIRKYFSNSTKVKLINVHGRGYKLIVKE